MRCVHCKTHLSYAVTREVTKGKDKGKLELLCPHCHKYWETEEDRTPEEISVDNEFDRIMRKMDKEFLSEAEIDWVEKKSRERNVYGFKDMYLDDNPDHPLNKKKER